VGGNQGYLGYLAECAAGQARPVDDVDRPLVSEVELFEPVDGRGVLGEVTVEVARFGVTELAMAHGADVRPIRPPQTIRWLVLPFGPAEWANVRGVCRAAKRRARYRRNDQLRCSLFRQPDRLAQAPVVEARPPCGTGQPFRDRAPSAFSDVDTVELTRRLNEGTKFGMSSSQRWRRALNGRVSAGRVRASIRPSTSSILEIYDALL
jgi:hypothetical protein